MKLSIIIPVFKGENTLILLFNKIQDTLEGKYDYEVLFVDDNAIDSSWKIIKELHSAHPQKVKGYKLKYNYGQHKAILFAISESSGDYLITLDEDMQHDPKFIPQLLSHLLENQLDVVYGNFLKFKKNGIRKIGSMLGRRVAVSLIPNLYKGYSPFRVIKRKTAQLLFSERSVVFLDGLLGYATNKIGEYSVEHFENKRPSSYSFLKLVQLGFSVLMSYSRIARYILILLIMILSGTYLYLKIILKNETHGWIGLLFSIVLFLLLTITLYIIIKGKNMKEIRVVESIKND